ncbi:CRISPR-associated protein Cas4 [Acetivibrio mesophilus]|uniref:CRISPR-associated exonuclease Cas4 n=1 Tax=Acetivibrio mesophilus TaxID=2487273 RepID=A0A4Q0I4Y8_9FIRM|nr:CRISPR-associated protein Cas4 [Acetivibrio mesophilus]ODM27285.1 CRISPR-associated protein Cas4 [Clostridium sp. Bc-iso-3]RXE58877.1 CRISPR-associated protein Cas4 [Acetivibrio mesophilus]HHV29527.1 CRISPR-associated protein Cas4 [Clostridium sp.]
MSFDFENYKTQGVKVNYYYVCQRKLWLFSKGITMEHLSDRVLSGKVLHETAYSRQKNREIEIDDIVKLDIIDGEFVREIKLSSKMSNSHRMQLLYYLYYLHMRGIEKKGIINYVKEKKQEFIELSDTDKIEIEKALVEIKTICNMEKPPSIEKKATCKKCSYYEFCFVQEVEIDLDG